MAELDGGNCWPLSAGGAMTSANFLQRTAGPRHSLEGGGAWASAPQTIGNAIIPPLDLRNGSSSLSCRQSWLARTKTAAPGQTSDSKCPSSSSGGNASGGIPARARRDRAPTSSEDGIPAPGSAVRVLVERSGIDLELGGDHDVLEHELGLTEGIELGFIGWQELRQAVPPRAVDAPFRSSVAATAAIRARESVSDLTRRRSIRERVSASASLNGPARFGRRSRDGPRLSRGRARVGPRTRASFARASPRRASASAAPTARVRGLEGVGRRRPERDRALEIREAERDLAEGRARVSRCETASTWITSAECPSRARRPLDAGLRPRRRGRASR